MEGAVCGSVVVVMPVPNKFAVRLLFITRAVLCAHEGLGEPDCCERTRNNRGDPRHEGEE